MLIYPGEVYAVDSFPSQLINTGDGSYVVNAEQEILWWNDAATSMLGHTHSNVLGKQCWHLLQGTDANGVQVCKPNCYVRRRMADGEPIESFDLRVRHDSGHYVAVNVSTIVLRGDGASQSYALVHLLRRQPPEQQEASHHLRIYLLGSVAVQRPDDTFVDGSLWRRTKVRTLFTYLALHLGSRVTRDALLELLWPGQAYRTALRSLNTTVYNLRRSLEPTLDKASDSSYIHFGAGCYWLNDELQHWLDSTSFETKLSQARSASEENEAIKIFQDAITLYRDDYLTDLVNTPVCSPGAQYRYQEQYVTALEELANLYVGKGQYAEAEDTYLKVLELDACREPATQGLMQLLAQRGRPADAVFHCRRLHKSLAEDLNLTPSNSTQIICAQAQESC